MDQYDSADCLGYMPPPWGDLRESAAPKLTWLIALSTSRVAPGNLTPRRSQIPEVNLSIHPARATA